MGSVSEMKTERVKMENQGIHPEDHFTQMASKVSSMTNSSIGLEVVDKMSGNLLDDPQ